MIMSANSGARDSDRFATESASLSTEAEGL